MWVLASNFVSQCTLVGKGVYFWEIPQFWAKFPSPSVPPINIRHLWHRVKNLTVVFEKSTYMKVSNWNIFFWKSPTERSDEARRTSGSPAVPGSKTIKLDRFGSLWQKVLVLMFQFVKSTYMGASHCEKKIWKSPTVFVRGGLHLWWVAVQESKICRTWLI